MPLRLRLLPSLADPSDGPGSRPPQERAVELPDETREIRIGRRADIEVPLPYSALSSLHARLTRANGSWQVEDFGQHQRHQPERRTAGSAPAPSHHPRRADRAGPHHPGLRRDGPLHPRIRAHRQHRAAPGGGPSGGGARRGRAGAGHRRRGDARATAAADRPRSALPHRSRRDLRHAPLVRRGVTRARRDRPALGRRGGAGPGLEERRVGQPRDGQRAARARRRSGPDRASHLAAVRSGRPLPARARGARAGHHGHRDGAPVPDPCRGPRPVRSAPAAPARPCAPPSPWRPACWSWSPRRC